MSRDAGPRPRRLLSARARPPVGGGRGRPFSGRPRPLASGQSGRGRQAVRARLHGRARSARRPPRAFLDNPVVSVTQSEHVLVTQQDGPTTRGKWQIPSISTNVDPSGSRARPGVSRWARQGIVTLKMGGACVARRRRPWHSQSDRGREPRRLSAAARAGAGPAWSSS